MKIKLAILTLLFPLLFFGQIVDNGYEKGEFVDGYKDGIWEYYDNDILILKVDYTTGKLVYLANDTSNYAIKTKNGWELSKLDIYPHYIGSNEEIVRILGMNIRYPTEAKIKSIIGTVLLGFEINLQGQVDKIKILRDIGGGCGEEVMRAFQYIPNYWLVASKDGKQYKSRYILPVKFQIGKRTKKGDKWKREPKTELIELNESKTEFSPTNYLEEVVLSAVKINQVKF